jgi:hypothetical protein
MRPILESTPKDEIINTFIELYEAYLLADNYRRVSYGKELLGISPSASYLQKYQACTKEDNKDA